jgi:hypothetical protein
MKSRIPGAIAVLFAVAGWAAAEPPAPTSSTSPPAVISPPAGAAPLPHNAAPPVLGNAAVPSFNPYPASAPCAGCLSSDAGNGGGGPPGGAEWYASADYLLWSVKKGSIPETASVVPVGLISIDITDQVKLGQLAPPVSDTPHVIGFAPVSITSKSVFGAGNSTNFGDQNGARFTFGYWADSDHLFGLEFSAFYLERGVDNFAAQTTNPGGQFTVNTGFTRNLFLLNADGSRTLLNTFPIILVRQAVSSVAGSSGVNLWGAEVNARCVGLRYGCVDFGGLLGARYLQVQDDLTIFNQTNLFRPDPATFPVVQGEGTESLSNNVSFNTVDRIRAFNHFVGAQFGADMDARFGSFFTYLRLKLALGPNFQTAEVTSFTNVINNNVPLPGVPMPTTVTVPPNRLTTGGLLAGPNDNGQHSQTRFSVLPELNLKVGYQFTTWLRGYLGYDALYLTNVARAGNLSSTGSLNTTVQVAGTTNTVNVAAPTFRWHDQDFWAQGFNAGFQLQW